MSTSNELTRVAYGDCRLLGHAWDTYSPVEYRGMFREVLHLRCTRCGTCRHDAFDVIGHLTHRKYEHPEGYGWAKDEAPSRESLRLAAVKSTRRPKARKPRG